MANLLAEGRYKGTVRNWGYDKAGKKETPFAFIDVRLTSVFDEDAGELVTLEQPIRRIVKFWLTPAAQVNSLKDLRFLGYKEADPINFDPVLGDGKFDLREHEVGVKITHGESSNGRPQENIWLRRTSDEPITDDAKKSLVSHISTDFAAIMGELAAEEDADKPVDVVASDEVPY